LSDVKYGKSRVVTWADPAESRAAAAEMGGLEIMRAIRDGGMAEPPMARLIDFRCVGVEPGEITMTLEPRQDLENSIGMLHGATAAALLDTAMGAAYHTLLPKGAAFATSNLSINYLRPLTMESGTIRATGRVVRRSRQGAYVEGFVRNGRDELCVHAVGNFSMLG